MDGGGGGTPAPSNFFMLRRVPFGSGIFLGWWERYLKFAAIFCKKLIFYFSAKDTGPSYLLGLLPHLNSLLVSDLKGRPCWIPGFLLMFFDKMFIFQSKKQNEISTFFFFPPSNENPVALEDGNLWAVAQRTKTNVDCKVLKMTPTCHLCWMCFLWGFFFFTVEESGNVFCPFFFLNPVSIGISD